MAYCIVILLTEGWFRLSTAAGGRILITVAFIILRVSACVSCFKFISQLLPRCKACSRAVSIPSLLGDLALEVFWAKNFFVPSAPTDGGAYPPRVSPPSKTDIGV